MSSSQIHTNPTMLKTLPIAVGFVAFCYWVAQYIFVPVLPLEVQAKTTSLELTGLALSIYGLGHLVVRIPAGILSGWMGRNKPLVMVGLMLLAFGAYVMVSSGNISQLIIGRGLTGIAAGTWVPLVLLFNNSYPLDQQSRATGTVSFISALARLSATVITPIIVVKNSTLIPFWISIGFAFLALLILFSQKEKRSIPSTLTLSSYQKLITRKDVLFPSLLALLTQHVNWALTFGFLPTLARSLGAGPSQVSEMVPLFFVFFVFGSLSTVLLGKKLGDFKLIFIAFAVMIAGILLSSFAGSMNLLRVAQIFIGFSVGICEPLLMAVSIQKLSPLEKPAALGFHQTIYAVGMFSGPFLSGILAGWLGLSAMFMVTAVLVIILSGLLLQKLFASQPSSGLLIAKT